MTTAAEVERWVRPLAELHPTMVPSGRFLLFNPVGHLLRALAFFGGSSRYSPGLSWILSPLFIVPGLMNTFSRGIPVGDSNWPTFHERLAERGNQAIVRYLAPCATIEAFYELALDGTAFFIGGPLARHPGQNAVILTALGRFSEAEPLLLGTIADLHKQAAIQIERAGALLTKRPNSAVGKLDVKYGQHGRKVALELDRLTTPVQQRDIPAIAGLLREWEQVNAAKRKVEQHWQPTPFPFEVA